MFNCERYFQRDKESLEGVSNDEFIDLIVPKVEYSTGLDNLASRLSDGGKLNIKLGIDPTGPDIHLGHIVPVRLMDLFSRSGHNIDLIFGDFTAKVGDPAGRDDSRAVLDDAEIAINMTTYRDQVNPYFCTERPNVRVHKNSTWLGRMALSEAFGYLQAINLTEATQRNDFRTRMESGKTVSLAEAIYGTLMGIDSVELETDVELGGIDQLLNVHQARSVQKTAGQVPEEIILTPIIEGTTGDGRKMSKSYGNYVSADADPTEIFGKIMSIPDSHIVPYLKAFAPIAGSETEQLEEDAKLYPFELKKQLATYLVTLSSGELQIGVQAREDFERRFSERKISSKDVVRIEAIKDEPLVSALIRTGDFKSKSDLRRVAVQGGIKINGRKISEDDLAFSITQGDIVSVGKRRVYSFEANE